MGSNHSRGGGVQVGVDEDVDSAFPDLVRAHMGGVYSIALRWTGSSADAEDIAQDVFVRAYRALIRYDADRRSQLLVRPWLATITLNACRNRSRAAARRPVAVPIEAAVDVEERGRRSPAEEVAARAEMSEVAAALALLPEAQRRAVVLHHAGGLTYAEVAEALERPEGTVKADVHRGLRALRSLLPARELPA